MKSCNGISKIEKNDNRVRVWEKVSDWFAIVIASIEKSFQTSSIIFSLTQKIVLSNFFYGFILKSKSKWKGKLGVSANTNKTV